MSKPVSASGDEGFCTGGGGDLLSCRERGPER